MEKKFFVYILRCRDDSLYTGYTQDIEKRLRRHEAGLASKYTRVRLPLRLVHLEEWESKSLALKREYAIKQLSKAKKEALIRKGRKE
ncbi:MAG: GIY-YIG nuclease family protein [Peptostreptococcaceae bacterium]|nr:GIY-YIG nuclease family protein [Peptostreptococcaceae bacterium]